jgi:hypothetical protein
MLDKKTFAVIIFSFSDLVGRKLQDSTIDMYYNAIKNYTDEQVTRASEHILKTHKFNTMPLPALFVEAIEGNMQGKAIEAWENRRGFDPFTSRVLGCCDPILPETTYEELKWIRQQFLRAYESMQHKAEHYNEAQLGSQCKNITDLVGHITNKNNLKKLD